MIEIEGREKLKIFRRFMIIMIKDIILKGVWIHIKDTHLIDKVLLIYKVYGKN